MKPGISDAECDAALARAHVDSATEIRAQAVRYLADKDMLEIETIRNGVFLISRSEVKALKALPTAEITQFEIWPDGSAIELASRDIQISIDGLLSAVGLKR